MRPFSSVRCSNRGSALSLLDCSPGLNQPRVVGYDLEIWPGTPILPKPESTEGRPRGQPLKKPECIRGGLHSGHNQAAFRRLDRGLRLGAPHRRAVGPSPSPRPHPGDERRKLQAQAQPGERRVSSSRRWRGRIGRTINAVSSCSFNVSTLTDLLPSVITSVVHDHAAPVAQYLGAIDRWGCRRSGLNCRERPRSSRPACRVTPRSG